MSIPQPPPRASLKCCYNRLSSLLCFLPSRFKSLAKQGDSLQREKVFLRKKSDMREDFFDDQSYDPDGYYNDPSIEELLSKFDTQKNRPPKPHRYAYDTKATDILIVDQRIADNYCNRISRIGEYRSRRAKLRCRCNQCDVNFLQTAESLFRSAYTRCKCTRREQLPTIKAKHD